MTTNEKNPGDQCDSCLGFRTSDCCGAECDPDILICHDCKEHCGTQCEDCETKNEDNE